MSNYNNIEDPLIRKESDAFKVYSIRREDLWYYLCFLLILNFESSFFDPDNIREGTSLRKLRSVGGTEGLLGKLRVSAKDGLSTHDDGDLIARMNEYKLASSHV